MHHTWTFFTFNWTWTIDPSITWTVGSSPVVFDHFDTVVDFTVVKVTIFISITVHGKGFTMFDFNTPSFEFITIDLGIVVSVDGLPHLVSDTGNFLA